jgi:hypothetical protein
MLEFVDQPAHNLENFVSFSAEDEATSYIKSIAADLIFFVMSILLDKPMLFQGQKNPQG